MPSLDIHKGLLYIAREQILAPLLLSARSNPAIERGAVAPVVTDVTERTIQQRTCREQRVSVSGRLVEDQRPIVFVVSNSVSNSLALYVRALLTYASCSFSEIIPQSLCTRYGLYFGAKMAGFVQVLIWTLVRDLVSRHDVFLLTSECRASWPGPLQNFSRSYLALITASSTDVPS